jgi:hypothetical protein
MYMFIKYSKPSAVPRGYLAEKSDGSEPAILEYKGF